MDFRVYPSPDNAAQSLAREIATLIRDRDADGRRLVIGLATGRTPLPLYRELIRLHREEGLSFRNVITFNLDEYYGLKPEHPQSYRRFMQDQLFGHIDVLAGNIHIPQGGVPLGEMDQHCREYELAIENAGGIDLQILGIGRTGHIGFNEPGSGRETRTRLVELDPVTRADAAGDFGGLSSVPEMAVTMGCGTILAARMIALMAWGGGKAPIVERAFLGDVSDDVPASFLQSHSNAAIFLDEPAAGLLMASCEEKHQHSED